ncbi:MAG: c-type cytochrome [Sphingomonadales bacterium]|nr:c-type cytochrome [Sphingomonadales bacterium]MBD3773970.1 c-type cytochrome [Paracoccaceae bacterium]
MTNGLRSTGPLVWAAPLLLALVAGCQTNGGVQSAAAPAPLSDDAREGLAFARAHCAACHAVAPGEVSTNPNSPPFEQVANTEGLTQTTLATWLHDSHNYPAAMNFDLSQQQADALAAYLVTLRSPDYKHPIQ